MPRALRVPPLRESRQLETVVNGQQFRVVHDVGSGKGTPLLLMNGIGAKLELLQPFVDRLNPQRDVIRFDAPGSVAHQRRAIPTDSKDSRAKWPGFFDELGFDQADVLGISWVGVWRNNLPTAKRSERVDWCS